MTSSFSRHLWSQLVATKAIRFCLLKWLHQSLMFYAGHRCSPIDLPCKSTSFFVVVRCLFSYTLLPSLLPNTAASAAAAGHQLSVNSCSMQDICIYWFSIKGHSRADVFCLASLYSISSLAMCSGSRGLFSEDFPQTGITKTTLLTSQAAQGAHSHFEVYISHILQHVKSTAGVFRSHRTCLVQRVHPLLIR